ncbi:ATP-binding protein [Mycobacteroides franklinii]|uniref:AAA-like domain protein n=1 Tax=Mycobacteroides franklinii TaxID=948102 RepID=A0A4R8R3K9_9MYCO|nr:DUF87 domain-containing protein [Mycobacteroides franklinii]ORA61321.1 ATPase [Mycobacteroides franklinii]TDH22014.1 ATP-binding protein [Mycobacteroides franklinii]TDZ43597.1 AAA-like domain protein [Mycobacteroides franklinii]TDZ50732.1 AAA-like domain protein [Mycobacteroides franklinii]TDZ57152.1 AAA-like domain protein [Mycobacteroides franklinii]
MATESVTTAKVDYLQRCGESPQAPNAPYTVGDPASRRMLHVRGISRPDKDTLRAPKPVSSPNSDPWRPTTAELITGLYGYRIPLAYTVRGSPHGVQVYIGTWPTNHEEDPASDDAQIGIMGSVLRGLYPAIDLLEALPERSAWRSGGLALGVPAPAGINEIDGAAPIDQVIRSMSGSEWAIQVLAQPMSERGIAGQRQAILNEMRTVMAAAKNEAAPSPLADHYVELLKAGLVATSDGMATGAWRTAVYLLGDDESYPRLASAWRSVMSGAKSLPEPVRTIDLDQVCDLANMWALPDTAGALGPGHYRRPFEHQTLLSSAQLAACVHLPELETPGYTTDFAARFDLVPGTAQQDSSCVPLGRVLQHRQPTSATYDVGLDTLTRHAFIAGVTGSGKTNTVFYLLQQLAEKGVPFLVIEPTKSEYRSLVDDPLIGPHLQVFTLGDETVSPLRLNPFEFPPGVSVGVHLDLLRSVFNVSFGMWTPLPQVLETCLYRIYEDRGWDITTNRNRRLDNMSGRSLSFPTLADLAAKVDEVAGQLGYDKEVENNIRAALGTRLNSLRVGGKGRMLDVQRSLSIEALVQRPTVLELEGMGDDDDKAFVMGLFMIGLAEHLRGIGAHDGIRHLLIVEEAHRLLAGTGGPVVQREESGGDVRGKAVETFANLISEIRAYGQGLVIVDQVPSKLAPDVVKNTNLKLVHRIVASDDRATLASAMVMNENQARALATFRPGQAAVFADGDDAPLLLQVPEAKRPVGDLRDKERIRSRIRASTELLRAHQGGALFYPRTFCASTCADAPEVCAVARELAEDVYVQRTFARVVLAAVEQIGALDRLWPDVIASIDARRPRYVDAGALQRALAGHLADWFAQRRGAQENWNYSDTADYSDRLRAVLLDKLQGTDDQVTAQLRGSLHEIAHRLAARSLDPYPLCGKVCDQVPPQCLYRAAVADVVASGRYEDAWYAADETDARSEDGAREETWQVCQDAAYEITEFPDEGAPADVAQHIVANAKRVCMCFAQQMLVADTRKSIRTSRRILDRIVAEAEL